MTDTWTEERLRAIADARELEIAVPGRDGALRRPLPIWVVRVEGGAYVRTWHRRTTGWFGAAVRTGRARIRVPGLEADVRVVDVGAGPDPLRAAVDAAFRAKYGDGGTGAMVTDDAAAATLRLDPAED
jgi:hypothetical protein